MSRIEALVGFAVLPAVEEPPRDGVVLSDRRRDLRAAALGSELPQPPLQFGSDPLPAQGGCTATPSVNLCRGPC